LVLFVNNLHVLSRLGEPSGPSAALRGSVFPLEGGYSVLAVGSVYW
jgi:hypothetical protein